MSEKTKWFLALAICAVAALHALRCADDPMLEIEDSEKKEPAGAQPSTDAMA